MNITVISDTHGILPEALKEELKTSHRVIHAGDIDSFEIYQKLKHLNKNTYFVKGNCDRGIWAANLPETLHFHLDGILFYVIHNRSDLAYRPENAQIIISGHTHRYAYGQFGQASLLNPGSCSQPRDGAASYAVITTASDGTYQIERRMLSV